jgi:hypothetical protein
MFTFYQMCWGSDAIDIRKFYCSSDRIVSDYVFTCILYVKWGLIWTAFVLSDDVWNSLNSVLFWVVVNYKPDLVVTFSVDSDDRNPIFRRVHKNAKSDYELRHVCLSVRPTVHMEYLGSHWMDLYGIWYLSIFRKSGEHSSFIKIWQESRLLYAKISLNFLSYLAQFLLF